MNGQQRKNPWFGIFALFGCLGMPAHAEEPRLSLAGLIREAAVNNPEIRAAEQRWLAARTRIPQAQTLPDPKFNLGYKELNARETMYGVSQGFPFPGKLRLRGEVAASEADIMQQDYLATGLQVIAALKQAYFDLHFIHESETVLDKTKRLLEQFEATAEVRYSVGQGAQQDIFRAQVELSRLLARLATLEQKNSRWRRISTDC